MMLPWICAKCAEISAGFQALGRKRRQHDLIHAVQPPLPLADDLRLERPVPIPRRLQMHLPVASVSTVFGRVPLRMLLDSAAGRPYFS